MRKMEISGLKKIKNNTKNFYDVTSGKFFKCKKNILGCMQQKKKKGQREYFTIVYRGFYY